MLLIFSSHSNNSEQVLREVQLATDSRLAIIRFRIEDVALNDDLKYFLSTPHWLDALTPPLSNHIARLEIAIKELLGQSVEVTGKNVVSDDAPRAAPPAIVPAATPPVPSAVAPAMPPLYPKNRPREKNVASRRTEPKSHKVFEPLAAAGYCRACGFRGESSASFSFCCGSRSHPSSRRPPLHRRRRKRLRRAQAPRRPARVAKVTKNPASEPARPPKTTPAADTQDSDESESDSAFERAGALKRPNEPRERREAMSRRAHSTVPEMPLAPINQTIRAFTGRIGKRACGSHCGPASAEDDRDDSRFHLSFRASETGLCGKA